ncbi:YciI family protein [Nocardioides sp.]|uniref:YciI family protein n=1 Tax=Nocardioides sp. TaxID=35761 RepID=UPI00286C4E13|nr:YciI family protein [Nocardioides sp.]
MNFLVLVAEADHFERWAVVDEAGRAAFFEALSAFEEAVAARGSIVAGAGLAPPAQAVTLRPGQPLAVGPYAETVEQMGGFYLIDVPDLETAVEVARLMPAHVTVEVRPTADE